MATNLALDDSLVNDAKRLGGHQSKRAAVTKALDEYVLRLRKLSLLKLRGQLDWDLDYDYKAERHRR